MKDIKGYEGHYKVNENGEVFSFKKGKPQRMKPRYTHDGYIWYSLSLNNKQRTHRANRLVAEAYIPNPENKATVNHIDGDKTNNHVSNLEWATKQEQMAHAYKLKLKKPVDGINNGNSALTVEEVKEIRNIYKPHCKTNGMTALSKRYNVSTATIMKLVRRETYKNID